MSDDDDDLEIATSPSTASVQLPRPNSETTSTPDIESPRPPSINAILKI